ncbi:MAG: hypothetical protein ACNA8W_10245 [Bradymonadaceae bacterium]
MNTKLLIDAVLRQTTVLVAHLATSAGLRAPLANIANSVFLELSEELSSQGVSRKVQADMFGMALRTYQSKIRRFSASQNEEQESVWRAVFEYVRAEEVVSRVEVLREFYADDESTVRGILWDLVESGLVFQNGRGAGTVYRVASDEDLKKVAGQSAKAMSTPMVWLNVYLHGPVTEDDLVERVDLEPELILEALSKLLDEGRISRTETDGTLVYTSDICVIPMDDPAGWETAFFDHFNAVVTAACVKLRSARLRSLPSEVIGGSTYSFEIWKDHPMADRVLGLLGESRRHLSALREEVDQYNEEHRPMGGLTSKVTFYFGQSVIGEDDVEKISPSDNGE